VPVTESHEDVSNIDEEFLQSRIAETPAEDNALTNLHNKKGDFNDFEYVNEDSMGFSTSTIE